MESKRYMVLIPSTIQGRVYQVVKFNALEEALWFKKSLAVRGIRVKKMLYKSETGQLLYIR